MGHASVNVEREVKFKASLEFELPDLRRLGLGTIQLPAQTLTTSYFDTTTFVCGGGRSHFAIVSARAARPGHGR